VAAPTKTSRGQAPLFSRAGMPGVTTEPLRGVLRSDDGGATWQSWSHGLQTPFVFSLAASPGDPHRIYAATRNGVWVLTGTD
jgi:hypothetical protein